MLLFLADASYEVPNCFDIKVPSFLFLVDDFLLLMLLSLRFLISGSYNLCYVSFLSKDCSYILVLLALFLGVILLESYSSSTSLIEKSYDCMMS